MPHFNRFAPSKYKNQLLVPEKPDKVFTEFPSTTPGESSNGLSISCGPKHLAVSLGNAVGFLDWNEPKIVGRKVSRIEIGGRIGDIACSHLDNQLVGVVAASGVKVVNTKGGQEINLGIAGKFSTIQFHPHAREIVSTSTISAIDIYSTERASSPSLTVLSKDPSKQHTWSPISGTQLASYSISNVVSFYDPRAALSPLLDIPSTFQTNRPSHFALLDDGMFITTGTVASTRTRALHLYELRSPSSPSQSISFDSSSSPSSGLIPLVDYTRRLVYIVQSHSSSIFAFDFNEVTPIPTTLHLPSTITGAALLPQNKVDVMRAEINRLYVLTKQGEITPVSVRIERKSYLDFHEDLFPDIFCEVSAITGAEWLGGNNTIRKKVSMNPEIGQNELENVSEVSPDSTSIPSTAPINTRTSSQISTVPHARKPQDILSSTLTTESVTGPPSKSEYTRKYLTGRLHHPNTHFSSLPSPPTTSSLHRTLHANSTHLAFPLTGPGGRIAYLALDAPGRQENPPIISNGSTLVDFALCPHNKFRGEDIAVRVVCAGENGTVNVFGLGDNGMEILASLGDMEKVVQVEWHPWVFGLIAILNKTSQGYEIRLWDYGKDDFIHVPLEYVGYGFAWNKDGSRIVVAGGDNAVHVLDTRNSEGVEIWKGTQANSSLRAFSVIFCGDLIALVGFGRGSSHQICLYTQSNDTAVAKIVLDISPAAIIPYYDDDTSILFLWSKGSRQIHAYHVSSSPPTLKALPSFNAPDVQNSVVFLPKCIVDVKKVEILQGLRFTASRKIERFGFSIPRNKIEYFQDDIFVPTFDTPKAVSTSEEWFNGAELELPIINLTPTDMIPLSQALSEKRVVSTSSHSIKRSYQPVRPDKGLESNAMEGIFAKAKMLDLNDDETEQITSLQKTDVGYDDDDWA